MATKSWSVAAGALLTTCSAWACSGVGPPAQPVVFGDQTNIVIWDETNHIEHFIRNASFKTGAADFGFIAPTPGKPDLEEASTQAFYTLAALDPTVPAAGGLAGGSGGLGGGGASRSAEVKVIQEADVAGYHATTLWSKNAGAINDWMNEHGYVSTPEVEKWAERYTAKGWYLTAFKVIDKSRDSASTGTVRMSFNTDRPFNPFYVPKTNFRIDGGGTLRVYFVAVGDYEAHYGFTMEIWQKPLWTVPVPIASADQLAKQVKLTPEDIPAKSQVETFVDNNFPRAAPDDIFFSKKPLDIPKEPEPRPVRTIPPLTAMLAAGVGLFALVGRRRPIL